jgi:NAD(P)-dependent dehydrogenase (short-subunit alcohol dehydrogenase family)
MTLPLAGRIALVTGASRGIGRAVALELARNGAHIIAVARTQGALEELDDEIRAIGGEATLAPADMRDFDALDRLGRAIFDRWGRLDILIANAGQLGPVSPLSHIDPPEWENVYAVNVTANYRLIRSLDALLRQSDAGRVIFISSGTANKAKLDPYKGLYASSKAALDAISRVYAAETATTSNVKVMSVNPGKLRTRMRAQLMPGEDPTTLPTPEEFAPKLLPMCLPSWTETGKVFDAARNKVRSFQGPA